MARKKKVMSNEDETNKKQLTSMDEEKITKDIMSSISSFMKEKFGAFQPPNSFITPFGIKHLDAIIGGGFSSQSTICLTSTPETGKSTIAYQFCKIFLDKYKTGMVIFLDIENVGGEKDDDNDENHIMTRAELYGLNETGRFHYEKGVYDRINIFDPINSFIEKVSDANKNLEKNKIKLLVVLDSIASLPPANIDAVEKTASITGQKSAQIQLTLDKLKAPIALNDVTFLVIVQVRSNMKIDNKFSKPDEKSVGSFGNLKSATASTAFHHRIGQWLMLSKKEEISLAENIGVDGWKINIFTEKNKSTASRFQVTCIFDKIHGLDKFWSEYEFLSEFTPTEKRLFTKTTNNKSIDPFMNLCIETSGGYSRLNIIDPDTKKILYQSPKGFYKKNAKNMYNDDPEFKKWFDFAVDFSVNKRIFEGLFRIKKDAETILNTIEEVVPENSDIVDEPDLSDDNIITDVPNISKKYKNLTDSPNVGGKEYKAILE